MTKTVLLRVGIDSGSGGIQGPLFKDGSFEFICIPDKKRVSIHKYGTCHSQNGIPHVGLLSDVAKEDDGTAARPSRS